MRTVIGVEAENDKRKSGQQLPDDREHVRLADLLAGGDELHLRHTVHRVDVIHAFDAVLVALMHAVYADVALHPVRLRGGARRVPMGAPVGFVLVQCRRLFWYGLLPRRLYRLETGMPARRS